MAKNIYIIFKYCNIIISNGGAVVEPWAADHKDGGSPPTCVI